MLYRASLTNHGLHFIYYLLNLTLPTVILPIFYFIALISQFLSSFPPSFSTFHKHVPQPTLFLHCNCKISTLVLQKKIHLQFHINDEDSDTNTTNKLKHKNLTNEMHWTEIPSIILLHRSCLPQLVVHSFPNAIMHGNTRFTAMSVAKKTRILCKKGK